MVSRPFATGGTFNGTVQAEQAGYVSGTRSAITDPGYNKHLVDSTNFSNIFNAYKASGLL
jgi:hypothetical protein